jgi:NADPH:quinone reductase-like Zn-dependent oxidoreductase
MAAAAEVREMRAVRFHDYGAPSVLMVEDVARPEPKEGEVLLRVRAAGVNAIDWKFRAGYLKDFMPLELPHILGYDVAGTVEEVGAGVSDFAPGDDVFGRGAGTYADYAIAPVATLARKPAGISFEEAATLGIGGVTAWAALFDTAKLQPGQRLLVQGGAGGVGSLAVQLAHWKGAQVIATTSTGNMDHVRSLGADEVIDYTKTKFDDVVHDVDVVLDTIGGEVTDRSWNVLKPGGMLVVVAGMPEPEKAAAHGVRTSGVQAPQVTRPVLEELVRLVESGALAPQVRQVFPLSEAAGAHAAAETGHGRGRIVLQVSS